MRVPVVFVFRVLLMAWLGSVSSLSHALAAQTATPEPSGPIAPASEPVSCDRMGYVWFRDDGSLLIDRRLEKRFGITASAYRLDDKNGFWLYPSTDADFVVLAKPDVETLPVNLSIASLTDADAVPHACPPTVRTPLQKPPPYVGTFTGANIAPLSATQHTLDPLACDELSVDGSLTDAFVPTTPVEAAQLGISGTVVVEVALDQTGAVTSAKVTKSPSPLLNAPSIYAAEHSHYMPAYFRCKPIAARYNFLFEYDRQKAKN